MQGTSTYDKEEREDKRTTKDEDNIIIYEDMMTRGQDNQEDKGNREQEERRIREQRTREQENNVTREQGDKITR